MTNEQRAELLGILKDQIKDSLYCFEDENEANWKKQEGVLLSRKEAVQIVDFIESSDLKKVVEEQRKEIERLKKELQRVGDLFIEQYAVLSASLERLTPTQKGGKQ